MAAPSKVITEADLVRLNSKRNKKSNMFGTKDEAAKRNKNTGNPYRCRKGPFRPGVQPPQQAKICGICSKDGCLLSLATKLEIFKAYWTDMDTTDKKYAFLHKCIEVCEPKSRTVLGPHNRVATVQKYSVTVHGMRKQMCQKGFLHVLQIKEKILRTVVTKMRLGNQILKDERGKQPNRHIVSLAKKQAVIAHIRSFPTRESHYARMAGNPLRHYLEPTLNLGIMYNKYIEFCRANNGQQYEVEESYYRDVFKTFKLSFGTPKQDTCDMCDKLRILEPVTPAVPSATTFTRDIHHSEAEASYQAYKDDCRRAKADPNYVVLTGDLQQVIFTPNLKNSSAFYLRKLSNYNFGLHNAGDDSADMHIWDETVAARGSNEISSCLWKYLGRFQPLAQGSVRELVLWTDRCCGQNNNFILLGMLSLLVRNRVFSQINHKLFVTGHSFNSCDRDFGILETKMRKSSILLPSDIEPLITGARSDNPFNYVEMRQRDFLDFMRISQTYRRPATLKVTKCRWFLYESTSLSQILSRESHSAGGVWVAHRLQHKNGNAIGPFQVNLLQRAYTESRPLQVSKVNDLEKLLPFLPPEAASYYEYIVLENIGAF